jgi:phosphoribosylformylglycinamidine synthase
VFLLAKIRRLYVRKKEGFCQAEARLCEGLKEVLGDRISSAAIYHRYDVEGISDADYEKAKVTVFSEPPVDSITAEKPEGDMVMAVEFLPGQYDQRADSAEQCLAILTGMDGIRVRCALHYVFTGNFEEGDREKVKKFLINPVESREASTAMADTLDLPIEPPAAVPVMEGVTELTDEGIDQFISRMGLAMSHDDMVMIRDYFRDEEHRNPTETEIRVLDTYWSDHCRHTTFSTRLDRVDCEQGTYAAPIARALDDYRQVRVDLYGKDTERPVTLMDMATAAVKELRKQGLLQEMDESEEINACTIKVKVNTDKGVEDWLLLFKNETHNHPTEIEPFGGAATCLGGCIRDPLSGRAYVYQAMRVTGAGDPRTPLSETLPGKLPQKKITLEAARGYSSYGNQIGLATGQVKEYYHPGFITKRMEIGALVAAAPADHVIRMRPEPGDVVILVGGRTGHDGMGGATGSSKELNTESIETCGAEVQKGNPITERKIQCLFRRGEVTRLIKRCNDFGAGGVSVAVGELTDGVDINLDRVPKKYEGLNGTELAIAESQERMAVVVRSEDAEKFIRYAAEENLEATVIANVTDTRRLVMKWRGDTIVDISRDFLNTNGAQQTRSAHIAAPEEKNYFQDKPVDSVRDTWLSSMKDLNNASQQGLGERFDSTIGAATVLMPYGGKYQKTPADGMVAKLPMRHGNTDTASYMTHGYDPALAVWSPFHGAVYAVLLSVTRLISMGADWRKAYLTLQEYFEKLTDETSWGKPSAALLGAFYMQRVLGLGAIGGKDSMSGTFNDLHVPPTLVSFAVAPGLASEAVSQDWKQEGSALVLFDLPKNKEGMPDMDVFKAHGDYLYQEVQKKTIRSMKAVGHGGLALAAAEAAFGNGIGAVFNDAVSKEKFFGNGYGSILVETDEETAARMAGEPHVTVIGRTGGTDMVLAGEKVAVSELLAAAEEPLSAIYPVRAASLPGTVPDIPLCKGSVSVCAHPISRPRVFIPVMPGNNCEIDSARAFERAGAETDVYVVRNRDQAELKESVAEMTRRIGQAQIVMIPGGFSAGDEPDGSGKFIAALFRNRQLEEAMEALLHRRDGLVLGICNGFQALIKLGLVPYGEFKPLTEEAPTLTFNTIGRHLSQYVTTKVVSTRSPWLSLCQPGDLHSIAISHGEGRFIASDEQIRAWIKNGQVATLYTDAEGRPSYDSRFNPNESMWAVEGITSPDGRVLGKMGHSERCGDNVAKNIPGNKVQPLFAAGVRYFTGK